MGTKNSSPTTLKQTIQEFQIVNDGCIKTHSREASKLQYLFPKELSDEEQISTYESVFQAQEVTKHQSIKKACIRKETTLITNSLHLSIDEEVISEEQQKQIEKRVLWNEFVKLRKQRYLNYYEYRSYLGSGGFGKVIEVIDKFSGRKCAGKRIDKNQIPENKKYKCFLEMDILSSIDHPYIVKLYEVFDYLQKYVLIFEFIEGKTLEEYQKKKILTENQVLEISKQLLKAVSYLHSKGIVHRDIKCENILKVNKKCMIKLIDFGAATYCKNNQKLKFRIGTLPYMAPQVLAKKYDKKCDIWSIGIVLYRIICGRFPFAGTSRKQLINNISNEQVTFKSEIWKQYSEKCIKFIKKLLMKNPLLRPSAKECLEDQWFYKNKTSHNIVEENAVFHRLLNFKFKTALDAIVNTYVVSQLMKQNDKEEIQAAFHRIDKNKDGVVSREQLQSIFYELFKDKSQVPKIMQILDLNNSGLIDYTQFLIGTVNENQIRTQEYLSQTFHFFDIDHNGTITIDQLTKFLEEKVKSSDQIRRLFDLVDQNKDGIITKEEFLNLLLKKKQQDLVPINLEDGSKFQEFDPTSIKMSEPSISIILKKNQSQCSKGSNFKTEEQGSSNVGTNLIKKKANEYLSKTSIKVPNKQKINQKKKGSPLKTVRFVK